MPPRVLAFDYDGTLAKDGKVDADTVAALRAAHAAGCSLVLVTGRIVDDLHRTFAHVDLFERVVAENGALVYTPATHAKRLLAPPPPAAFAEELTRRGAEGVHAGDVIVATWRPHDVLASTLIAEMRLDLAVIFNKEAVMILPRGVDKGTGLRAAFPELGASREDVAAFGDAENDHALFDAAAIGVAVANAVPALKHRASIVTIADHGAGVREGLRTLGMI